MNKLTQRLKTSVQYLWTKTLEKLSFVILLLVMVALWLTLVIAVEAVVVLIALAVPAILLKEVITVFCDVYKAKVKAGE